MTHTYQTLQTSDRIKLFKECQRLLIKNHPTSEFIVRRNILSGARTKSLETLIKLYQEFNGKVYIDDNCVVFFKIFDIQDGIEEIYKKYDEISNDEGNTLFIVFSTFVKDDAKIQEIVKKELSSKVKKISFSRNGKFKLYPIDRLISRL